MIGSAGRTDLVDPARTLELTEAQFRSLSRLATLPAGVRVLPTHGAGSFCGSSGGETRRRSTVGAERETNPALRHTSVAAFVSDRLSGLLEYPAYYRHMAPLNRSGPASLGDLAPPGALAPEAVERALRQGVPLVDGRDRTAFADAHIPGSLNIELSEEFATYLGWLIPWNAPVVLVLPDPLDESLREALVQARRIGFDRVVGYAAGGVDAWSNAGGALRSYPTATVDDLRDAARSGAGAPALLDVRQPSEWAEGTVPGSRTIFVGDLPGRLDEVPVGAETWIACRTGHRAAMAASLLDGAGRDVRLITPGGVPDVLRGGAG
jgi:rhodanese-related sulfurtransferase